MKPTKKHTITVVDRATGRTIRQIEVAGHAPRPPFRASPDEVINLDRRLFKQPEKAAT